ncbi:MAG: hypothetical protein WD076_11780 [Parvularculaceae bacterium]
MSLIRFAGGASIAISAFLGAAYAQSLTGSSPGFHYFHKAGYDIEQHDADLVDCAVAMRALVNGSDAMTGMAAAAGGGLLPALIGGVIDNNENRQGAAANTENCMAIRRWSVIGLTSDEGNAMEGPSDAAAIHSKLAPLVNAGEPQGPVLRGPFANELAIGNFKAGDARDLEEVSLSVRAVSDKTDAAVAAAGQLKPPKPPKGVKAPKSAKAMKADDLVGADPANSYAVFRALGDSLDVNMTSLTIHRLNADGTEVVHDGAVATAIIGGLRRTGNEKSGDARRYDYVVEIPPGLWKIATIAQGAFAADLCFGAPAFEVGAGETVFLGAMTIAEAGGYPLEERNLDAAKEILNAAPALAEKVRAAEYTNGFLSDCFGSYAYAYEVPGAPFIDLEALARSAAAAPAPDMTEAEPPADGVPQDTSPSELPQEQ